MPTIAVLSEKPAFVSILATTLRHHAGWRVRAFSSADALLAYMRLAPLAILVSDYDLNGQSVTDLAADIRSDPDLVSSDVQIIALAARILPHTRDRCVRAGIDEVIVKPMSPVYLEERVRARIESGPRDYVRSRPRYVGPDRRGRIDFADTRAFPVERRIDNVIFLSAHWARGESSVRPDA